MVFLASMIAALNMRKYTAVLYSLLFLFVCCNKNISPEETVPVPETPVTDIITPNPFKAPLYWSPYEYNYLTDGYIPENEWAANIDWVEANLKSYGYNMICIDGWGDDSQYNEHGYRTTHSSSWSHDYAWWSANLQSRGMTLGMYNNPLWIIKTAADAGVKIKGTNIPLSSIMNEAEDALWFKWVQVDRPGAEEYVKGYIQFYADMGIKYLRVDFLSWFETGHDRNIGTVGPQRPLEHYQTALRWMKQACDSNGIFLSLVMPHLNNDAAEELKFGHMVRINEDAGEGQWWRFSEVERGTRRTGWSQYANAFDGFTYWSKISGRNKMILDGDFIRINTFNNDDEKKSVISLHILAGGPVTVSDQYNTIGNDLWLYQNEELLALHKDGFSGKPMVNDPRNEQSQVWKGQLTNGDWIIGLFNRESSARTRSISFDLLGIQGNAAVRDLWKHAELGGMSAYTVEVPAHGCVVIRVRAGDPNQVAAPTFSIAEGTYSEPQLLALATSTGDATIYYTTDGSSPDSASQRYADPIKIDITTTVKAIAIAAGVTASPVAVATFTIRQSSLPSPWIRTDIGTVGRDGFAEYDDSNASFVHEGSGADIEGTADHFSYIHQEARGNFTITARVTAISNTHPWAKAGVMIRETVAENSANVFLALTALNGVSLQKRTTTGGQTTATVVQGISAPQWLRITRTGDIFTAYYSSDGNSWTGVGSPLSISMVSPLIVGLPVTSHNEGTLATATFTNVTLQ